MKGAVGPHSHREMFRQLDRAQALWHRRGMLMPDEPTETKYIVTKADGTPVDDAVVIRMKDPFASTALYSYNNAIMTVVEIMADSLDAETQDRMLDIADYFHQRACESQAIKGKRLPD